MPKMDVDPVVTRENYIAAIVTQCDELIATVEILIATLSAADVDKSNEAVTILLMQAMDYLGPHSGANPIVMQQLFPVMDRIKHQIVGADLAGARRQSALFKKQLLEIRQIIIDGPSPAI
jgi:hypothetical protein